MNATIDRSIPAGGRRLPSPAVASRPRRGVVVRRRIGAAAALAVVLAALGYGVADATGGRLAVAVHGHAAAGGDTTYVVQRGDSLWSIARAARPDADPRPLVGLLRRQLGRTALQPGDRLVLPR